jgi:isopenicillin-N epimerase
MNHTADRSRGNRGAKIAGANGAAAPRTRPHPRTSGRGELRVPCWTAPCNGLYRTRVDVDRRAGVAVRRRTFLAGIGAVVAGGAGGWSCGGSAPASGVASASTGAAGAVGTTGAAGADGSDADWAHVREQFALTGDLVHMSALFIASHPRRVREAIDSYRHELDESPVLNLQGNNRARQQAAREAAAGYLGADQSEFALTDSTTMGLGLVYNGLRLEPGDEVLTTDQDYYVTHESLRTAASRSGAAVRRVSLYDDIASVSADQMVERLAAALTPRTRVVALTWVHSGTGLKLPVRDIAGALRERHRGDRDLLIAVDGVHGFGIENVTVTELGIDFFVAGCHKWLFGPRGTGLVWGRPAAWSHLVPIIPSFLDDGTWAAWLTGDEVEGDTTAIRMTPGGFKPFEHQWALPEAFAFHEEIGKARVEARTRELASHLKEGLDAMPHVRLVTPLDNHLSSGIVCFDVPGVPADDVVRRLRDRDIVGTATPYAVRYARLAPSIRNTHDEVDRALEAVASLT